MSEILSIQNVNEDVKKWDLIVGRAEDLLRKAENRAARLRGTIKTFQELREAGQPFDEQDAEILKAS